MEISSAINEKNLFQLRPKRIKAQLSDISPETIEYKMRGVLSKLDTSYVDTFDWSVYDKIAAKFGDEQPRGGVVFKTGLKLVNHHTSCSKCHYSFEIDTYGRGCTHNCNFCYAREILTRHGYWNEPHPFPVDLAEIRKIFHKVFETDQPSKWRDVLSKRIPLRLGSMSDCFMWMDRKYKVTYELLKILDYYKYPYIVFTRSDLIATDEYMKVLNKELCSIQFSICGANEQLTKIMEPSAPKVEKRLTALKTLAENDFWTTVRVNPLFPIYPDGYFTDEQSIINRFGSYKNVPKFDFFDWSLVDKLKEAKVPSLLVGFVRLSPFAIRAITKDTGTDLSKFFKPELFNTKSESRYSENEIATYYRHLKAKCDQVEMRFNTCYIGNGIKDYFQHQNLWSNKTDCCDARGIVPAFKTSSQDVSWETRKKHSTNIQNANEAEALESDADRNLVLPYQSIPSDKPNEYLFQ